MGPIQARLGNLPGLHKVQGEGVGDEGYLAGGTGVGEGDIWRVGGLRGRCPDNSLVARHASSSDPIQLPASLDVVCHMRRLLPSSAPGEPRKGAPSPPNFLGSPSSRASRVRLRADFFSSLPPCDCCQVFFLRKITDECEICEFASDKLRSGPLALRPVDARHRSTTTPSLSSLGFDSTILTPPGGGGSRG